MAVKFTISMPKMGKNVLKTEKSLKALSGSF